MTYLKRLATLLLLLTLTFGMISCNSSSSTESQAEGGSSVPQDDSQRMLDKETFASAIKKSGAVIVDVRQPAEFEQGHIEGAININFFDPEFKYKLLELDREKKYYLYCKNETRSYRSMKFMEDNSFKQVYMLKGGYQDWVTVKAE
jgi:rhodanese-related sulfurtransferase